MSEKEPSSINQLYTFLGCLGAIASFALIAFIAYLPQQADPADIAVKEQRQIKADEARAAGAKLESFAEGQHGERDCPHSRRFGNGRRSTAISQEAD